MPNATVRANARAMSSAKLTRTPSPPVADPLAFLPDRYALSVSGTCLEPEVYEGDVLLFDRTERYERGDLVAVFRRVDANSGNPFRAEVKRLIMGPPSWVKFPWSDHPDSDVLALVGLEMNNPRRRFALRCADILGIHKCLGAAPPNTPRAMLPLPTSEKERDR